MEFFPHKMKNIVACKVTCSVDVMEPILGENEMNTSLGSGDSLLTIFDHLSSSKPSWMAAITGNHKGSCHHSQNWDSDLK